MYLEDLATRLRTANISGVGQNVFINGAPSDISQALMILPPLDGLAIDGYLPDYYRGLIQVVARHPSEPQAYALARAASEIMEMRREELPTIFVNQSRATNLPVVYPRSEGDLFEASVTFDFRFKETAP
jgi:hypothetical protein